ncbi:MAG: META domain-containing protein [Puia sp.]|nr:META domain-containing protein [Puia sp.]
MKNALTHSIKTSVIKSMMALLTIGSLGTSCQSLSSGPGNNVTVKPGSATTDSIAGATNAEPVSPRPAASLDTTSLKGDWYLQEIKGSPIANLKTAFIRFDTAKSSFTGNTGCNALKGMFWYSDNDTSLVFGDHFLATKAACPGNEEPTLIKSLKNTNHYLLRNSELLLLSDDGRELSVWRRASPSEKTAKL